MPQILVTEWGLAVRSPQGSVSKHGPYYSKEKVMQRMAYFQAQGYLVEMRKIGQYYKQVP